nr:hypothetical protein [Tanacetum cinerariifolium]
MSSVEDLIIPIEKSNAITLIEELNASNRVLTNPTDPTVDVLKVWILETFSNSQRWWFKDDNVFPRCLAWGDTNNRFEKQNYGELLGEGSNPKVRLTATPDEINQEFWKRLHEYLDKSLSAYENVRNSKNKRREYADLDIGVSSADDLHTMALDEDEKVIKNGNNLKRTERDSDRGLIILPLTTAEEHLAVQRESKARTTLLQSIPDDHIADFHYMDDARDIWNSVKASFGGNEESKKMRKSMLKQEFSDFRISEAEGLHKRYDRMQKILGQLNQLKAKPDAEDINLRFLRALPSSWSQKAGRKIDFDKKDSARFNKKKVRCYKCQQRGHFARECREKGGNDKHRYSSFKIKEIGKKEEDSKALITIDTLVDWSIHDSESEEVIAAKEFGMIDGYDSADAIKEGATKLYNLINGANLEEANTTGAAGEFAFMGVTSELTLEDKIRVLSIELENTSNLLKHSERINADCETAKKDLQIKFNNHLVQTKKWRNSSKNLYKLIDSSMSVRNKVGLGFTNCISENELRWDDSAFSVFTTTSEDVEGRPTFHRFAKTDSMKVIPPSLSGDYTSLSDHIDLDESKMSYGTKSLTSCDSKSVSNDFVSCDDSNKSSKPKVKPVPTGKPKVKPVPNGKPKVTLVPTGKPKVTPVSTGKPKVTPVPTGIYGQLLLSPQQVVLGKHIEKDNPFSVAEDEVIFYSGCFRSMTGNKERLDDFQAFHGGKVTFGGDTECLVLSNDFKLPDDSMVVLKVNNTKPLKRPLMLFCCVFFLEHKDETYPTLKSFINLVENQLNKRVKAIRCDNGTEFKNAHMIDFCGSKEIKREYSNPRTPQQNRVAERKNKTLIKAARTMLADSKLPTMFWTEAVKTACYILNRVFVTSPHNKTPYALLTGNIPTVSHFKLFGCHVTILNTSDHLGKFDGKADEGYIIGYSASNKAYRGLGHAWYFDLDYLTDSLGYIHVLANQSAGTQGATTISVGTPNTDSDSDCDEQVIIIPSYPSLNVQQSEPKNTSGDTVDDSPFQTPAGAKAVLPGCIPVPTGRVPVPTGSILVPTGSIPVPDGNTTVPTDDVPVHSSSSTDSMFDGEPTTRFPCPSDLGNHDPLPGIFSSSSYDDEFDTALNNVASSVKVSPVPTKRINTIHPQSLIIGDPTSAIQT